MIINKINKQKLRLISVSNGRSKANNVEPIFAGILNTLNETWDSEKYKKISVPVIEAIDESESSNQMKKQNICLLIIINQLAFEP